MTQKEKELVKDLLTEIEKLVIGKRPAPKKQEKILKKLGFTDKEIEVCIFM